MVVANICVIQRKASEIVKQTQPDKVKNENNTEKRRRIPPALYSLAWIVASLAIVATALFTYGNGRGYTDLDIADRPVPLAGVDAEPVLYGRLTIDGMVVSGIELSLMRSGSDDIVGTTTTDEHGNYYFMLVYDGMYYLLALIIDEYGIGGKRKVGIWQVLNGLSMPVIDIH